MAKEKLLFSSPQRTGSAPILACLSKWTHIYLLITKNLGIILSISSVTIFSTSIFCEFYFQNILHIHPVLSIAPTSSGSSHFLLFGLL